MEHLAITYQHIADILSFEISNSKLEKTISHPLFNWDAIVIVGSSHLVLPAIYCRLKAKQLLHLLPEKLNNYLMEIASINRNRNNSILNQVKSISQILNEHNIEHVFLKGTALLISGYYKDNAERMVGDIDILVSKNQLQKAFKLLNHNGYDKTYGFAYETIDFRHLDRLISHKELASIELHSDLLNIKYRNLIDINNVLDTKVYINKIPIPNQYYLGKHQILSWQLNDNGHYFKSINFKTFYDSIILGVQTNDTLITDLLKFKFGQSFLEFGKLYFKEFHHITSNKKMKFYRILQQKYISNSFFKTLIKPTKSVYINISKRINLCISNKYYRKHLLKKIFLIKKY